MKNKILVIFALLLFSNILFAHDFALKSVETEENTVTVYRGKSMQTVSDDSFLISMLATKNDHGIQFATSITNYSSEVYLFREDCITVYQGVYEDDSWEQIKYVPATLYFENEKKAARTEEIWSAIALGLNAASAGYSTVNGSTYVNGRRYSYTANVYSPADAAIATTNSYIALDNLQKSNQNYLQNLEDNLLFDSLIPGFGNYNGFFVVDEEKGPDYKVVFEMTPGEDFVFYFTRSDKEEILNPWMDKSHDRHSVIVGISPALNHFSAYYLWSRPKGVGAYTGVSFRTTGKSITPFSNVYNINSIHGYDLNYADPKNVGYYNYDWKFDYDKSNYTYTSWGWYGGLTIKTVPYTWLLLGVGMDCKSKSYYEGDLYYKSTKYGQQDSSYTFYKHCWLSESSYDILFAPQVGVNFIANNLDIGCMATIPINGKFNIDITLGFAF